MPVHHKNKTVKPPVDAYDLFGLMSVLLEQADKPDLTTKNLWVVALDRKESILNLELCAMGNYLTVVNEPADILGIPLQKKAFGIVLIHNSPTGNLTPSQQDIDLTDRLNQAAEIVNIKLLDHLIITENSFYGFKDNGLMDQIYKSAKYLSSHQIEEKYKKEINDMAKKMDAIKETAQREGINMGKIEEKLAIAKAMIKHGDTIEKVAKTTGLSLEQINTII